MKYMHHSLPAHRRNFSMSCLIFCALTAIGYAETASEYLSSAHLFGREHAIVLRLAMTITENDGQSRSRTIELLMERNDVRTRTLGRIVEPAFLSQMKFLKITERGKQDIQWMKTSQGTRRLGDSSKSEAVFGSHFSVEDFGSLSLSEYDVSFGEETAAGGAIILIANPIKNIKAVSRRIWIDPETRLVSGMDYFDVTGKLVKRYSVIKNAIAGGVVRPSLVKMEDLVHGGWTSLQFMEFKFPESIQERWFNPGGL